MGSYLRGHFQVSEHHDRLLSSILSKYAGSYRISKIDLNRYKRKRLSLWKKITRLAIEAERLKDPDAVELKILAAKYDKITQESFKGPINEIQQTHRGALQEVVSLFFQNGKHSDFTIKDPKGTAKSCGKQIAERIERIAKKRGLLAQALKPEQKKNLESRCANTVETYRKKRHKTDKDLELAKAKMHQKKTKVAGLPVLPQQQINLTPDDISRWIAFIKKK